jgi:hypothetical protein
MAIFKFTTTIMGCPKRAYQPFAYDANQVISADTEAPVGRAGRARVAHGWRQPLPARTWKVPPVEVDAYSWLHTILLVP